MTLVMMVNLVMEVKVFGVAAVKVLLVLVVIKEVTLQMVRLDLVELMDPEAEVAVIMEMFQDHTRQVK